MNKALDYLGRYSTSQYRLREVLNRFALRKLNKHDPDQVTAAINTTVTRCEKLGYLNDEAFAQSQARSHRRLGRSKLGIRHRLRRHRLDENTIDAAVDAVDKHSVNGELLAACLFAKRRRLGPFDLQRYDNADDRQAVIRRQLGSMARAGFNMGVSCTVIGLEDMAAANMLIVQLEQGEDPTIKSSL